ncbi:MAG: hypothetical protein M3Z75_28550 [Actinomycetota bacterium]|nr:hypothetical protein [Actinomycetota bacterium]
MTDLYASFPATAATRTIAHLAGLAGALPASLLLAGVGVVTVQLRDPIGGGPSITVLAAGLVLVIAAGAVGTAIGTGFPHPLAGLLGALALFLPTATAHLIPGWSIWLIPWQIYNDQLGSLPGPLTGYPPAGAHAAELAGGVILAAIVALAMTVRSARARGWLTAAAVLAAAATCFAGVVELGPVPAAQLNHLAAEMADPGSVQHCTTGNQVTYCLYPGFSRDLSWFEAPVDEVLALLPARSGKPLTVQQVLSVDFTDPGLTRGQPAPQISQWNTQKRNAPGNTAAPSAIYLTAGGWPAAGGYLANAKFNLALATAEWADGLACPSQPSYAQDQAREAIAIWLALLATHTPAGELQHGVEWFSGPTGPGGRKQTVAMWMGNTQAYGVTASGLQLTDAGYLLATAMTGLPEQKVSQVLANGWATWLNARTTGTQLAAALGIQMPALPQPPSASLNLKP